MLAMTFGNWIADAVWWMKKISTAMSATVSASVTVTPMCGTKSPRGPGPIDTSTSTA